MTAAAEKKPAEKKPLAAVQWTRVCSVNDLVAHSGIAVLVNSRQLALFYLPDQQPSVFVLDNWCPAAQANVLSRGIVGDINGEPVVASPLYKEHFSLLSGQCLEKPLQVQCWPVRIQGETVEVMA